MKRKPGRPPLSGKARRSVAFMTMLTREEAETVRLAATGHRSMAEFLRKAIMFVALQRPSPGSFPSMRDSR